MRKSRTTKTSRFSGQYADDGKAVRKAARDAHGNRCVRCLHPYRAGNGTGEWSPCDEQCAHGGPLRLELGGTEWVKDIEELSGKLMAKHVVVTNSDCSVSAKWRILTVHHFDGNKANDAWWNLLPLCQRCHLQIQGKVDPRIPYFFEHSDWLKPFVAGYYAHKYEGKNLTREETLARLDELLAYEFAGTTK